MPHDKSVPELPTELTDAIIDHLHDDKPTLLDCSLVCSSWLESSRYHLFRSIRIRGDDPGRGYPEFIAFIDGSPHVHKYIQEVCFRVAGALASRPPEIRSVGPYLLSFVLETLPSLRSIILDNVSWDRQLTIGPEGCTPKCWPPASPKALDTLTFTRVVTEDLHSLRVLRLNDIVEILGSLRSLRVLNFFNLTLELNQGASLIPALPEDLQLEELNAHANYARLPDTPELDAFHESVTRQLRKLSIACRNDDEAPIVGSLLRTIGTALEELKLDHSDMSALRAFSEPCRTISRFGEF